MYESLCAGAAMTASRSAKWNSLKNFCVCVITLQLLAGIEKVLLPILSQNTDNEFRIEELVWSELGDFVRELLETENL